MITTYLKQFEFEYWSNQKVLEALRTLEEPNDRAFLLFSHLLSSHAMWLCRVNGVPLNCTLFQERTLDECEALMLENLKGWQTYLNHHTEEVLQTEIYFDAAWTNNERRKMKIEDALIHLINHSSYHRGQIIASIKGKVPQLPLTTYIMYASEIV